MKKIGEGPFFIGTQKLSKHNNEASFLETAAIFLVFLRTRPCATFLGAADVQHPLKRNLRLEPLCQLDVTKCSCNTKRCTTFFGKLSNQRGILRVFAFYC